jgi:acyl-CoA hydrolase
MRARTASSSRVEMTQIVMPTHTNGLGGVLFGGTLVQWIDVCAAVAAMRHCGGTAVTASIDRLDFLVPIHVGDIVVLQAQVNYAARTSMEVGCRVETEHPRTGKRLYTTKAYLTFVATDAHGRPRPIPPIRPVTREEKRRYVAAEARRIERLELAGRGPKHAGPTEPERRHSSRKRRSSSTRA